MDAVKKWKKSQNNAYKNKTKGKKNKLTLLVSLQNMPSTTSVLMYTIKLKEK